MAELFFGGVKKIRKARDFCGRLPYLLRYPAKVMLHVDFLDALHNQNTIKNSKNLQECALNYLLFALAFSKKIEYVLRELCWFAKNHANITFTG
jgi:hypothetical protein